VIVIVGDHYGAGDSSQDHYTLRTAAFSNDGRVVALRLSTNHKYFSAVEDTISSLNRAII
jgi:hypothetical protein